MLEYFIVPFTAFIGVFRVSGIDGKQDRESLGELDARIVEVRVGLNIG